MYRALCVLGLMSLYVGLAHSWSGSWDFAAVSNGQLDFFVERTKTHTENISLPSIDKSTYDVVHNRLFFSSGDYVHDLILSYDIATEEIQSLITASVPRVYILDMAFDPVQELLFWTGSDNNIYSYSLKLGNRHGEVIISTTIVTPVDIAVDSCKGYIYWTNKDLGLMRVPSTIERARFDGSEREVLIGSNLQTPTKLVIDPQTQRLYWTDGTNSSPGEDSYFSIECADLNGHNRITLYNESMTRLGQPTGLAVSKDSIYLGQSYGKIVKQIPKYPTIVANPELIQVGFIGSEIFTNYKIEDQFKGIQGCEAHISVLTNDSMTDNVRSNVSSDNSLFCVHGMIATGDTHCKCALGYIGWRCEVSVCHNYCFNGSCSVSAAGQPTCRCDSGYSGERCEVNKCEGYCLNNGVCSLNMSSEPVCQCKGDYEGERCEVTVCLNKCFQKLGSIMWGPRNAESNTWRHPYSSSRTTNWYPSAARHS